MSADPVAFAETSKNYRLLDEALPTVEKTFQESAWVADSMSKPFNTDDLYEKRGDYTIYEEMKTDDQVSVALQLKKDLVLGGGWEIVSEDPSSDEARDYLETSLMQDVERPFDEMLEEILTAYEFGFSITEKIFQRVDSGLITLKELKTRHPGSWLIHTDERGNITSLDQQASNKPVNIDLSTVIHYVNKPSFQNPYGNSDLRSAYAAWFVKQQIIRYYSIFLEKYASPTPIAKYDKNAPKQAVTDIFEAIKKFQSKTALAVPKDIEVEFLDAKGDGQVYIKGINLFNMFIGRSLLIPDLLGFQGSETSGGSFSLGKEQIDIFINHIARRKRIIERIVNLDIIRPIVVSNFGLLEPMPYWRLKPVKEENSIEFAKLFIESVKGKLYEPSDEEINHFRSIIQFPEGEVIRPEPAPVPGTMPGQDGEMPEGDEPALDEENFAQEGTLNDTKHEKNPFNPPYGVVKPKSRAVHSSPYGPPSGSYYKRTDFKEAQGIMQRTISQIGNETSALMKTIFGDFAEQIRRKGIIQNQNIEKLDELKLKNLGQMNAILKTNLKNTYRSGRAQAKGEIFKVDFRAPLDDETFLEVLDQEIFQYIKDWDYKVRQGARIELINALKDGRPLSSVLDAIETEGLSNAEVSIERFARTKATEVLNKGRLEFFNKSNAVSAYQYSAILDDRTTPICSGLDGKIFNKGDEPVPPLHFNCRSLLIPITVFEDFKVTEEIKGQSVQSFIDENIGEGFSVK